LILAKRFLRGRDMGLLAKASVAIDGSKFKAVNELEMP
jgi:transposase